MKTNDHFYPKGVGDVASRPWNGSGIDDLWPDAVAAKELPPLTLRLVVVHNGKHPIFLVTNVLDAERLSDADAAEVYRQRWGIEVYYRSFKPGAMPREIHKPCSRSKFSDSA